MYLLFWYVVWSLKLPSDDVNEQVDSVYNEHLVDAQYAKNLHETFAVHNALHAAKESPELSLFVLSYPLLQYPTPIYVYPSGNKM